MESILTELTLLVLGISVIVLSDRVYTLQKNIDAIKSWLKVLGVIDLDSISEAYRKWQEEK